jgi:hypothetical protein
MKNHEKSHKELSAIKEKRDPKSKITTGEQNKLSNDDSLHRHAADEDMTARISFLIDFSLTEGQIQGKITHRLTNKQMEFAGVDQTAITQFMKRYLSRLEKSVEKIPIDEPSQQQIHASVEVHQEEPREIHAGEMQTRSFGVIPAGAVQPTELLRQGQPFQLQWSFEPPPIPSTVGEQLSYRVIISRKNLEGGEHMKVGEVSGKVDVGSALTARIPSEPLPPGAYRLEADSDFSLKSKKVGWHSTCRERRLIQVI